MWNFVEVLHQGIEGFVSDITDCETTSSYRSNEVEKAIHILENVPGMTHCRTSLFKHSMLKFSLKDGSMVRTWTNRAVGGDHVFIASPSGELIYGGFVWLYAPELKKAINQIRNELA